MRRRIRLSESQLKNIVRQSVYNVLNEGIVDRIGSSIRSGFDKLKQGMDDFADDYDGNDHASLSPKAFNKGMVAKCLLDFGDEGTETDYIGLGGGDNSDYDIIYTARDMGDLERLRRPDNGTGFILKSIIGIE